MYIQSDTSLQADIFENFQNKCTEIYKFFSVHFNSAPELAWQAALRKTKELLKLLANNDMLLIVEKVSEVEYIILFIDLQNLTTHTWKIMITQSINISPVSKI